MRHQRETSPARLTCLNASIEIIGVAMRSHNQTDMTVAPHKRCFSVSVLTRQRKHPYPFREATTCVNASQCMASHGQNSHGCSLPFCSQQCEHIVSSVSLSGDRIVPPSINQLWCLSLLLRAHIAPPYAAMASGLASTIAIVVNLPMLRPGTILHEASVARFPCRYAIGRLHLV